MPIASKKLSDAYDGGSFWTIAMLTPMCDPTWRIKARVIKKFDIKNYRSAKGEGKLFSFEIIDSNGTEISASFFNAHCDKWFDYLTEGNTYIFSGGYIKENTSKFK
jgi:replication factor A1